jgi:hypothetical protein
MGPPGFSRATMTSHQLLMLSASFPQPMCSRGSIKRGRKRVLGLSGGEAGEARVLDADYRERCAIKRNSAARDGVVAAERALPEGETQDDSRRGG